MICRICRNESKELIGNKHRGFFYCRQCDFVFVSKEYWVSSEEEKKRYEKHNNSMENSGYVKYLDQVVEVVESIRREPPVRILDFGSGKEAVLTSRLISRGFECVAYDPLFSIMPEHKGQLYDIIVLCEVIEHLRDIQGELELVNSLLKKDGVLIIRTQLYPSLDNFENWWYAQDKTHINFFSKKSITVVAKIINRKKVDYIDKDIFTIH